SKGLYPEQIHTWREECLHGFRSSKEKDAEAKQQSRADRLEIKALKKELRYKEYVRSVLILIPYLHIGILFLH
ncbi:hypothetical protein ACSTLX_00005, partial [Vibrio parahaemolyticus]